MNSLESSMRNAVQKNPKIIEIHKIPQRILYLLVKYDSGSGSIFSF